MSDIDTTLDTPLFLPVGDEHAFAILTEPRESTHDAVLVLATGANFGANPLLLRLARHVAHHGHAALRLDYLGTGESSGGVRRLRAAAPQTDEIAAAGRFLAGRGFDRVVPIGFCYGARAALAAAADLEELAGIVLVAPVVAVRRSPAEAWSSGGLARRLLSPSRWRRMFDPTKRDDYLVALRAFFGARRARRETPPADPGATPEPDAAFVEAIVALAARGVPICLIFGSQDESLGHLTGARDDRLRRLLAPGASSVEVRVLPGPLHPLHATAAMQAATDEATSWLLR
jgi:pimeloyl-ACP methyl ester carboxylesterase